MTEYEVELSLIILRLKCSLIKKNEINIKSFQRKNTDDTITEGNDTLSERRI